jgi:large subunit ribosomal protein L13
VKTYVVKPKELVRDWYVVDAEGKTLGRLASKVAQVLKGKHKPFYTPNCDTGDHVIIINADKVQVTGNKLSNKMYYRHSMYPGGLKSISLEDQLAQHPTRVLEAAVKGMLPKTKLGRAMIKKLKVYAAADHPHQAQNPKALDL